MIFLVCQGCIIFLCSFLRNEDCNRGGNELEYNIYRKIKETKYISCIFFNSDVYTMDIQDIRRNMNAYTDKKMGK